MNDLDFDIFDFELESSEIREGFEFNDNFNFYFYEDGSGSAEIPSTLSISSGYYSVCDSGIDVGDLEDNDIQQSMKIFPVDTDASIPQPTSSKPRQEPDWSLSRKAMYTAEDLLPTMPVDQWLVKVEDKDENAASVYKADVAAANTQQSITDTATPWPSSFSTSYSNSSNSLWFESDGEASFVAGDDSSVWATFSDSPTTAVSLDALAKMLVELYLGQTDALIDGAESSSQTSPTSSISSHTHGTANSSSITTPGSSAHNPPRKRPPPDDEEGSRRSKIPRTSDGWPTCTASRLLACPYSKFDPCRYSERNELEKNYRGCSSCFLKDIARLKQHLYRVHRRPEHHCPICFSSLDSKVVLDAHIVERSCQQQLCPFEEKMTQDQLMAIKRREMGRSRSDAWFDIYKILFPNSTLPLDPYVDSVHADTVQDFIAFFVREGRELLASEINQRMFGPASTTSGEQEFVDRVLADSINVLLQRLDARFRQPSSSDPSYRLNSDGDFNSENPFAC
ncbi:uncharacterized protein Z519_11168 [Cladophialophora bantiana CBS 173.52]|uniref:C2H2-type domain-containing protein n=1 Tax=Cladophialophora bantiana (strain ATCC 10958 / CBS 173.52 / CDC B-1940 / NIH 8579) TaxID=1442370 RepID=A0A0D2H472_CLAB1|nr:uncharacterized protein Z519_11168 [Cladophialophora bantiana CBS 173.52]KIW88058.1 hypothetical protein Z519_11168 [Cladophialophora bantiana CBS 173.52]